MNQRILIADNDEQVRLGLQVLLSNAGYTVLFAVDGISLIEQALKHQPHLVMLDACLPAGNSSALVQALRRFPDFTRMPIFLIGSKENRTSASQIFDSGANVFLPKPFNRQVLFSMIAKFLPSGEGASALVPIEIIDSAPKRLVPATRIFID